jgi:hypothetical protein
MGYTPAERETVINCCDETNTWNIYTLQTKVINKLRKLGIEPNKVDQYGAHYYFNLKFNQVSFRSGKERRMTDEQRKAAGERLARNRKNKKQNIDK